MLADLGIPMTQLGIYRSTSGEYWIVSLKVAGRKHDPTICAWCKHQFGVVDIGACIPYQVQEYWFTREDHAIACWLTWGGT